jgi:MoxR-like ATPase
MQFITRFFEGKTNAGAAPAASFDTPLEQEQPVYVYNPDIVLAVNVAFAAERPLLISGLPGSGKTTLARNIAGEKGWRYLAETITSRTQAADLLARFDTVRRLNDATGGKSLPDEEYLQPGVLWHAFNPEDAQRKGAAQTSPEPPLEAPADNSAVVLLDEIDKAEPDVPNDLLEPLDRGTFRVPVTGHTVERKQDVFIVITTNGERDLPPAFLRRCVVLNLGDIDKKWLLEVARRHYGEPTPQHGKLYDWLADQLLSMQGVARSKALRPPSTAEFLNAIRACVRLNVMPGTAGWDRVTGVLQASMWKHEAALPKAG